MRWHVVQRCCAIRRCAVRSTQDKLSLDTVDLASSGKRLGHTDKAHATSCHEGQSPDTSEKRTPSAIGRGPNVYVASRHSMLGRAMWAGAAGTTSGVESCVDVHMRESKSRTRKKHSCRSPPGPIRSRGWPYGEHSREPKGRQLACALRVRSEKKKVVHQSEGGGGGGAGPRCCRCRLMKALSRVVSLSKRARGRATAAGGSGQWVGEQRVRARRVLERERERFPVARAGRNVRVPVWVEQEGSARGSSTQCSGQLLGARAYWEPVTSIVF